MNSVSTPGGTATGRRALTSILAIIGILGVILGLLFLFAGTSLPHFMVGKVHHGHHVVRASVSIVVGLAFIVVAWLAGRRKPAAPGAEGPGT